MVPAEASNIAQIQEAQTQAPVAVVVCQRSSQLAISSFSASVLATYR
jgi:hypothetical protein